MRVIFLFLIYFKNSRVELRLGVKFVKWLVILFVNYFIEK